MAYTLVFQVHAVQRMFERHIGMENVEYVLETGQTIEEYPDDTPDSCRLILGWIDSRPIHVVVAQNQGEEELIVITVYEPDRNLWHLHFRRRRS